MHRIRLTVAVALLTLTGYASAAEGADDTLHIHVFSGSKEYQSEPSLQAWTARLEQDYDVTCTMFHAKDHAKVGAEAFAPLADADLIVVFCRRWKLKNEARQALEAYIESKKPIIGIRTGSHAWNYKGFDKTIMGGSYSGHGGTEEVQVLINDQQQDHPILAGISEWTRKGKLYHNKDNAADVTLLLTGKGAKNSDPLAWCREHAGRRTFYTGMGYPHDFENEHFRRLLLNAVEWCLQRDLPTKEQ